MRRTDVFFWGWTGTVTVDLTREIETEEWADQMERLTPNEAETLAEKYREEQDRAMAEEHRDDRF